MPANEVTSGRWCGAGSGPCGVENKSLKTVVAYSEAETLARAAVL